MQTGQENASPCTRHHDEHYRREVAIAHWVSGVDPAEVARKLRHLQDRAAGLSRRLHGLRKQFKQRGAYHEAQLLAAVDVAKHGEGS